MTRGEAILQYIMPALKRIWNDDTCIEIISAIEQDPCEVVLNKIRSEIDQITDTMGVSYNQYVSKIDVLQIIDKYKEEARDKDVFNT